MPTSNDLRLNLLITAEDGTLRTFQGVEGNMKKVAGVAAESGTQAGTSFSAGFGAAAITGIAALGAAVGGLKLVPFAQSAFEEAVGFARANTELVAQLQATNDASGQTATGIDELAKKIQKTQVIFEGTVKQGAALLLTFQEIRNVGGKGGDIFDRTLTVAAAISNIFHKDLNAAVTQVGRALENPQAGMQALSRSGLTLAKQDHDRILALAKQGDLLGAQKALLDVLEKRTIAGGAAAAQGDPLQRFRVEFEQFKVGIGRDLTPVFDVALHSIEALGGAFNKLPSGIRATIEAGAGIGILSATITTASRAATILNSALGGGQAASAVASFAAAEAAQARAVGVLVSAGAEAEAAQAALDAVIVEGTVDLTVYEAALARVAATQAALDAANAESIATQEALNVSRLAGNAGLAATAARFSLVAGGAVVATVGFRLLNEKIQETLLSSNQFRFDTATKSLEALGKAGQVTGLIADTLGAHFEKAAKAVNAVGDRSFADKAGAFAAHFLDSTVGGNQEVKNLVNQEKAIDTIDKGLAQMAQQGGEAGGVAAAAFAQISEAAKKGGASTETLARAFNDYTKAAKEAGGVSPFQTLQGQVELAKSQFADLLTKQAEGKPVSVDALAAARKNVIDVSQRQQIVEDQLRQAEAQTAGAADGATTATKSLSAILSELDGTATGAANALSDLAAGPLQQLQATNGIADAFDALDAALKKVEEDKANIAGTGDAAKAAAQAVVDARRNAADSAQSVVDANQRLSDSYSHLQDSQASVTTSLHALATAQHELDLYNSARGVKERALELDIIQRRVVTTPAESDQKQLDLLKFQDNNNSRQQQLQDAVTSAEKGYNDALKNEEAAHRAIADARRGVTDAVAKEAKANDDVTAAVTKQKQVQADAMKALHADQRKVQDDQATILAQIGDYITKFGELPPGTQAWLDKLLLVRGLSDNIRKILKEIVKQQEGLALVKVGAGPLGPQGFQDQGVANPPGSTKGRGSTVQLTAQEILILHNAGVPGFDTGGVVPGPKGSPLLAIVHGGEQVLTVEQAASGKVLQELARRADKRLPHFDEGTVPNLRASARARAQEAGGGTTVSVNQENHFHGKDTPAIADLEFANRELGWKLSRSGRS